MNAATPSDFVDLFAHIGFFACVLLAPLAGYVCMVLDIRAYVRRIRGMLVCLGQLPMRELPAWVRRTTPRCVEVFGLQLPCSEAELLAAYRDKVKQLHPDRGGDRRDFLRLQSYFEQARQLVG